MIKKQITTEDTEAPRKATGKEVREVEARRGTVPLGIRTLSSVFLRVLRG